MRIMNSHLGKCMLGLLAGAVMSGCGVQMGDDSARTPVTGAAGAGSDAVTSLFLVSAMPRDSCPGLGEVLGEPMKRPRITAPRLG